MKNYTLNDRPMDFVVVTFLKIQPKERAAEKLLFQMKIPVENKNNLHLRVKDYAAQYIKTQIAAQEKL